MLLEEYKKLEKEITVVIKKHLGNDGWKLYWSDWGNRVVFRASILRRIVFLIAKNRRKIGEEKLWIK